MPTKQILSADRMWPEGHAFAASAVTVRGSGSVRGGRGLGQTRDLWRTASHTGLKAGVRQGTARGREPGSLGLGGPGTPPARSARLFFSMLVDLLPKRAPSGLPTGLRRAGHWDTVVCELSVAGVTGHRRRGGFKQQDCSPWETYLAVAVRILLKLQAPLGRSAWPTGVSVRGPKPACPRAATWEAQ